MSLSIIKTSIVVMAVAGAIDGRCELPDIAVADKAFAVGRYAEALKGYIRCERNQIGERGYVIMREAMCAEKTGDLVIRGIALNKLCAMNLGGNDRKYVEAAYRMRYEKDVVDSLHTGDLDRFLREIIGKFDGRACAAEIAGVELKKVIRREEWDTVGRYLRKYPAAYPEGLTNAVSFVSAHLSKGKPVSNETLVLLSGIFSCDVRLAEFLVGKCDKLPGAWLLSDCMGNMYAQRSDLLSALRSYEKARSFSKGDADGLDYKIISVSLSMPKGRRAAIERAIVYLKSRPDSRWHSNLFQLAIKSMFDEKLFDEVDVLLADKAVCREGYRNEKILAMEAEIVAERDKKRKEALEKQAGGGVEKRFMAIEGLRKAKDFAGAISQCDAVLKMPVDDAAKMRAMRMAAEISFEDIGDYKDAVDRYAGLIRKFHRERRDFRLEVRLIESMVISGQGRAAESLIGELRRVFNADMAPDVQHVLDALSMLVGKVGSVKLEAAVANLRRADVLFAAEEYSLALKVYKSAVALKGASRNTAAEALMQVARCLARLGRFEEALSCYARLEHTLGRHQMSSDALMRMAVIYAGVLGNDRKAMEYYLRVENEYPRTTNAEQAMFYRLTLLTFAREWDKANELRKRFLKICKNDSVRKTVDTIYGDVIARRSLAVFKEGR